MFVFGLICIVVGVVAVAGVWCYDFCQQVKKVVDKHK